MKAVIVDYEALSALRPLGVVSYLRATGWVREEEWPNGDAWRHAFNGHQLTVYVPHEQQASDFPLRMAETVAVLAELENRSQLDLLDDLTTSTSDVIRVAVKSEKTANGHIPLPQAVGLLDGARAMMIAAACSAIAPRASYGTRKPDRAMRYLDERVQLGQSQRGSFVATILSRVPPLLTPGESGDLFPELLEQPFERRVTRLLLTAVRGLKEATRDALRTGDISIFGSHIDSGISSNLCEAIGGMMSPGGDGSIQISFSWSPARPDDDLRRESFSIAADESEVMVEAARILAETNPRDEYELVGLVVRLDRPENQIEGTVTVSSVIDHQTRAVRVRLAGAEYETAIEAHRRDRPVSLVGTLVKEGRSYELQQPSALAMIVD